MYGEDTYEQELRAYGYRQQERRERGSLSPRDKRREVRAESPFSRGSRHPSPVHDGRHDRYDDRYSDRYSDRYRDTDSQSGDRESVRSYRSVRSEARRSEFRQQPSFDYQERFVEEKRDHVRGFSPTSSDYSHHSHSPTRYRSRSTSPALSVGKERKVMSVKERVVVRQVVASSSLDDYPQSSRHSSPMDYDVLSGKIKDSKSSKYSNLNVDSKSKEHYPETRDSRERYGSEERTTISELIKKTRTGTFNDSEKVAAVSSKVVTKPKFDSDDDVSDMDRVSEVKDRPLEKRHSKDIVLEKDRTTDDGKKLHKHRSRSTSVGSRTRQSIPIDSDLVKYNKDSAAVSKPSKDLREEGLKAKTKHVKSDLPRSTKTKSEPYDPFETKSESGGSEGSSSSDSGSSSDEESAVEQGTLSSSARLQQQRQHLLSLLKQLEPASDNDSLADDDGTRKRLRLDEGSEESRAKSRQLLFEEIEQTKLSIEELDREQHREKAPKIDSSKSYRKQMEQRRLEQQKHAPASSVGAVSESKAPASPVHVKMDTEEDIIEPVIERSPMDIPTEFKKKRKVDSEADLSLKTRRYRPPNATDDLFARINEDDDKKVIKDIVEIKEADKMDKVVRDGRSSSVDTNEHPRSSSVDTSEHPSRQSSIESQDPRSPPLEYRRETKGTLEIRTEAGNDNRDSPMDRRSLHLAESHSKKDFPMSLPLPKFARQPLKDNHAGGKNSPKSLVSPKTLTPVSAAAPAGIQVKSPPFSPGGAMASPLHSPALPKADTPKEASSLPNSLMATPATPKDKEMKAPPSVAEVSKEKAKGLTVMVSPGSPPLKMDSDSEVSESEPGELSLEERIRALDEKMNLTVKPPSTPSSTTLFDYREKYKIRKRADSAASSLGNLPEKSEPSDIVKSLLARTSIFDQDSKRLEQIHEKYEPKVNMTLDDPRLGGGFRTKALAKDLPLLTPSGPAPVGPQAGSAIQLSPPFLGAPAAAAPAETVPTGEMLGNNTNSNSSGVATGAFSAVAFPSTPQPHKAVGGSPSLLPPPAASGPQSTPPEPASPTIPPASGASTQSSAGSPKLSGLDTMPQLSVAVNTPSMSPGLISRKGSLESATKSPLTPPVATTATSNIASMPSPSQTQPPQLDCQSQPKSAKKESASSSVSQSSTSSAPSTPVSILKKQDSNEVFSPVTPILKKEMPPLTPILKEQPSPPIIKKEAKEAVAPTPVSSSNTPQKSILGKRKVNDDTKDKVQNTAKQEKTPHKSSAQTTTAKQEPGSSKSSGEPEVKKAKVLTKDKVSSSKSASQKDNKKTSAKHGSSKSPEKKHVKAAEVKESTEKKKQDEKHVKHIEKSNSKERLQKDEDSTEKPKPSEPVKEKVKEAEKEVPKVKEHKEKEESLPKSRDVKHKAEKTKEVKEIPEKKVEKVEKEREKKVRYKSGDNKHREKDKTPSTDLKPKTPNDKHKDRHKVDKEKVDKSHKTEKHDKPEKTVEKEDKPERLEKIEKVVEPRNEKTKVDHAEKTKPDSKSAKHDKKVEKQDPKMKHKEKSKEKDGCKDRKEDRGSKSGHDSRESSVKPEKKSTKDNDKKKDKQKDRDQEKTERKEKDAEKNKEKDGEKSREKSERKSRDTDSNKDKETDSSHEREKETKEEREKRELKELFELQAKFNAEEGYLTMYDKVKRRSSKEREKELAEVARQKHFSAYQVLYKFWISFSTLT